MSDSMKAEVLSERLSALEDLVYGKTDFNETKDQASCGDQLFSFYSRFSNATNKREKITRVLNRVHEIEKYMDPTFFDDISLSNEAKVRIILAEEENIKEMSKALERLQGLAEVLNSEHLKNIPQMTSKFSALMATQLEQEQQSAEFTAQVQDLMESYKSSMDLLSKLFVMWDQKVTDAEEKQRK